VPVVGGSLQSMHSFSGLQCRCNATEPRSSIYSTYLNLLPVPVSS
jgi:hypothetical protein